MNALREAKTRLLTELNSQSVPSLSPDATTDEILALRDHFDAFVRCVDDYLLAIGLELARTVGPLHVSLSLFSGALRNATDGFCRYEFEALVEELRDIAAEAA